MAAVRADGFRPSGPDESWMSAELKEEIRSYVRDEGERWAQQIEHERRVSPALWEELRERGYLRLAAPAGYGGRGVPLIPYLELLEIFSMSHASLRMIVHVCNGIWRPIAAHATEERQRFLLPLVAGKIKVAFTLTEPTAGTGADLRAGVEREGDTYYLSGGAPDHVGDNRRLPTCDCPLTGDARRRGHGRGDGGPPRRRRPGNRDAGDDGGARHGSRPPRVRPIPSRLRTDWGRRARG